MKLHMSIVLSLFLFFIIDSLYKFFFVHADLSCSQL